MELVTTAPPADFLAGKDLENWPTRAADQEIAVEVLQRHSDNSGFGWLPASVEKVSDADGGTFHVTLPIWVRELEERFSILYGQTTGWIITQKTLRWLNRTVFSKGSVVKAS